MSNRTWLGFVLSLGVSPLAACSHHAPPPPQAATPVVNRAHTTAARVHAENQQFEGLVRDAYVYAYPYVLMDVTRETATSVVAPDEGRAPVNQFAHMRDFPDPDSREIVRLNHDTLYSTAWLDLRDGPIVLGLPDTRGRYVLMQVLDMATNVIASIGKRTRGTGRGAYAIVGPGFSGEVPHGVERIDAPSNTVWIVGRTRVEGPSDLAAARHVEDQYTLTPLAVYGARYTPPERVAVYIQASRQPPVRLVDAMDAQTFFTRFAGVLEKNPPPSADAAFLATLVPIGIRPGATFDPQPFATHARSTQRGIVAAKQVVLEGDPNQTVRHEGWEVFGVRGTKPGEYGTDYVTRAHVARYGLGANLPADAIYPNARVDASGARLTGAQRYRIHFPAGALPPASEFWSLSVYTPEGFVAPNPVHRYALGSQDHPRKNPDGSLDVFLGRASPGRRLDANWLPTPEGEFEVTLRVYGPTEAMRDGTWMPPGIERLP